jgi:large subunit ribosomal protein L35
MKIKLKTRKSAAKRVKIKKNCIARKKAYKSHILKHKNSKRLRRLSSPALVHKSDLASFVLMIPYS